MKPPKLIKKHILFLILIPIVFVSQTLLLKPHLKYGFDDTADQYITQFRQLQEESQNPIEFVIKSLDGRLAILWVHEHYYMGFLNYLFADNLVNYHHATHFFKSLAILSTFPLFLLLSGSNLVAFISSLIFAISYAAAGSLDPLVVGGDYIGIIALSFFLTIYFSLIKNGANSRLITYLSGLFFLISLLAIATTRSFPIVFVVLLIESFLILKDRSTHNIKLVIKRLATFILPIFLIIIFEPEPVVQRVNAVFSGMNEFVFSSPIATTSNSNFHGGMHELLLIPFLSFASTILPVRIWPHSTVDHLWDPMVFLFFFLTIIIGFLLSKKPWRFILMTFLVWIIGILIINWAWSTSSTHNLIDLKTTSQVGFYFLGLALSFFLEWLQTKNRLYIGLFLGPFLSFIFIFNAWLWTQERLLLFANMHRYLTLSTVFISFFIGSLIIVLYRRFKDSCGLRFAAYLPFLFIPFYILISSNEINNFYNIRFQEGVTLQDHDYMRRKLLPYLSDIDIKGRRLIYIDIYSDKGKAPSGIHQNSYYYGQIYHYGPLYWLHWYDQSLYKMDFHNSHQLVPNSVFDYDILKSMVRKKDEVVGIAYTTDPCCIFYKLDEFRAVRMMNREVIDIKDEVIKDLGLTE